MYVGVGWVGLGFIGTITDYSNLDIFKSNYPNSLGTTPAVVTAYMPNSTPIAQELKTHKCPRCRLWRPERYYVHPLVMCMVCYGSLEHNLGLSLQDLTEKARRSPYARRQRRNKKIRTLVEETLYPPTVSGNTSPAQPTNLFGEIGKDVQEGEYIWQCDNCQKWFTEDGYTTKINGNQTLIVCKIKCLDEVK